MQFQSPALAERLIINAERWNLQGSNILRIHVFQYCAAQGYESEAIYAVMDEMDWEIE